MQEGSKTDEQNYVVLKATIEAPATEFWRYYVPNAIFLTAVGSYTIKFGYLDPQAPYTCGIPRISPR